MCQTHDFWPPSLSSLSHSSASKNCLAKRKKQFHHLKNQEEIKASHQLITQTCLDASKKESLFYKDIAYVAHVSYMHACTGFHLYILGHWVIPFSFCLYKLCLFRGKKKNSLRVYIFWLLTYSLSQMSDFKLLAKGQLWFTFLLNFSELVKLEVRNTSEKKKTHSPRFIYVYICFRGWV